MSETDSSESDLEVIQNIDDENILVDEENIFLCA